MNNQTQHNRIEEDEIDLRELLATLLKHKMKIFLITFLITLGAVIYVMMKNPIPVYSGSLMVEIGSGSNTSSSESYFDNPNNLGIILEKQFSVSIDVPKRTNNLIEITAIHQDEEVIRKRITEVKEFVLQRHKEKLKFYDKHIMTKQIGEIQIGNTPINLPKKKLIVVVAFVTGFILSIFFVFFLEFIRGFRTEEKSQ